MEKIKIEPSSAGMSEDEEHLMPLLDFMISKGNLPSYKSKSGYWEVIKKEGRSFFYFRDPLPVHEIKEQFELPKHIILYEDDDCIYDQQHGLVIYGGCTDSEMAENEVNDFLNDDECPANTMTANDVTDFFKKLKENSTP